MLGKVQYELQKLVDSYVRPYFCVNLKILLLEVVLVVFLVISLRFAAFSYIPDHHSPIRISSQ